MTDKKRTPSEIEKLKAAWLYDPCFDLEDAEGFGAHAEELLNFRRQTEAQWSAKQQDLKNAHAALVREQTGVIDADIVSAINTWNEIERMVSSQDRYVAQIGELSEQVKIELMQTQIRATLLQAAQLKRIADILDSMNNDTSGIWSGSK